MIKCIVCDLDGTLIKEDDSIDEQTLDYIHHQDVEFLIATGRDYNMVIDILDKNQLDCDLILNNGAEYRNRKGHRLLNPMDNDTFIKVASLLHHQGYLQAVHTNNGKYAFYKQEEFWDKHLKLLKTGFYKDRPIPKKTFTIKQDYCRDFHYVEMPIDIVKQKLQVLKIDARHLNREEVRGIYKQLENPLLDISSSYEENIEITASSSQKGKMLEKVIQEKKYSKEEVAVFGDGDNDVSMLESFPYSFAPSKASINAKKAAHFLLTKDCEQGAVYEGILKLKEFGLL